MDILFVISHIPDNRYQKRIGMLKNKYEVGIIYWNKNLSPVDFEITGVKSYEINIPADKTNPIKRVPQIIRFIVKAYEKVKEIKPRSLYVGNLDMLCIAALHKKREHKCRVIYEIADLHRLIVDKQKIIYKKVISIFLVKLEKRIIEHVDILVLTSMKFFDFYYSSMIAKSKVIFMPNMPETETFRNYKKNRHEKFTIGFIGWIRYENQLRMLVEAADRANINVLFAGGEQAGKKFETYCAELSHVQFEGEFKHEKEVAEKYSKVDCIYAVYDADMRNVQIALPNKMYEAILCETPIIVAKNTYLAEQVMDMGIGIAVDHKDLTELENVLIRLSTDYEFYQNLCRNCRLNKEKIDINIYNKQLFREIERILE